MLDRSSNSEMSLGRVPIDDCRSAYDASEFYIGYIYYFLHCRVTVQRSNLLTLHDPVNSQQQCGVMHKCHMLVQRSRQSRLTADVRALYLHAAPCTKTQCHYSFTAIDTMHKRGFCGRAVSVRLTFRQFVDTIRSTSKRIMYIQ